MQLGAKYKVTPINTPNPLPTSHKPPPFHPQLWPPHPDLSPSLLCVSLSLSPSLSSIHLFLSTFFLAFFIFQAKTKEVTTKPRLSLLSHSPLSHYKRRETSFHFLIVTVATQTTPPRAFLLSPSLSQTSSNTNTIFFHFTC